MDLLMPKSKIRTTKWAKKEKNKKKKKKRKLHLEMTMNEQILSARGDPISDEKEGLSSLVPRTFTSNSALLKE